MNVLKSADQLIHHHQNGLERELVVAIVEKIFQTGSEEFKYHSTVIIFPFKAVDSWYPYTSG
jgi:uncharacterized protein YccT (UPF0319 family)